jgi:hypothetical protein
MSKYSSQRCSQILPVFHPGRNFNYTVYQTEPSAETFNKLVLLSGNSNFKMQLL